MISVASTYHQKGMYIGEAVSNAVWILEPCGDVYISVTPITFCAHLFYDSLRLWKEHKAAVSPIIGEIFS